jgi:peptidoglycan hydrolase-like protein with peptidoglycan-binding domain
MERVRSSAWVTFPRAACDPGLSVFPNPVLTAAFPASTTASSLVPPQERWQFFLLGQGLYRSEVDGRFGPVTREATRRFQRKYGLKADGIAGNRRLGRAMLLGFEVVEEVAVGGEGNETAGPGRPPSPCLTNWAASS